MFCDIYLCPKLMRTHTITYRISSWICLRKPLTNLPHMPNKSATFLKGMLHSLISNGKNQRTKTNKKQQSCSTNTSYYIILGKLQYFTNLNFAAIWGWFPLLTMIPVRSQWGRYNLPRLLYMLVIKLGTLWWTNIAIENSPVEIVDIPINNGDFPWQNVSSPEGIPNIFGFVWKCWVYSQL